MTQKSDWTTIVLYHPEMDRLTTAYYAIELIWRMKMGWVIVGEL